MGCSFLVEPSLQLTTLASRNGVSLVDARRRKERTHPELARDAVRARLIVLAAEGRRSLSDETLTFLKLIANAKLRSAPGPLRGMVPQMECHPVFFGGKGFCVVPTVVSDGEIPPLHSVEVCVEAGSSRR